MNKKINIFLSTIFPYKKCNWFLIGIIILGIISGSIFLTIINYSDKELVFNQLKIFIDNINNNSLNYGLALKNSIYINYLYVILIWIFGLSLIGIIVNVFLTYLKGFIIGFSISSIISLYKIKGLLFSILYLIPSQLINIIVIVLVGSYNIMFTRYLYGQITNKINNKSIFKKYIKVLLISIILVTISSLFETFLLPSLLKLIIKLFV